jgi:hypothetical protein
MPHIQGATGGQVAASSTISATLGSPVGIGNCVEGAFSWETATGFSLNSVDDDQGNTYNIVDVLDGGRGLFLATFFRANIRNGPVTVTGHLSGSAAYTTSVIDEYDQIVIGTIPDAHNIAFNQDVGGGSTISSGSATTSRGGALIYGATANSGGDASPAAGSGFTLRQSELISGDSYSFSEDRIQTVAGSIAATFTSSTLDAWTTGMIALLNPISPTGNQIFRIPRPLWR